MKQIISKVNQTQILHIIHRKEDFEKKRIDLINDDNFLQCSSIIGAADTIFEPHKHLWNENNFNNRIAQEAWVVIKGAVEVFYYDINDSFITSEIIKEGDVTITLGGGHSYKIIEDQTLIYEFKTGPYEGTEKDKVYIQSLKKPNT